MNCSVSFPPPSTRPMPPDGSPITTMPLQRCRAVGRRSVPANGAAPGNCIGRTARRCVHEECPMAVALREDRAVRGMEATCERPDGTRVPFIPYPTPLHDENGQLIGAINMLVESRTQTRRGTAGAAGAGIASSGEKHARHRAGDHGLDRALVRHGRRLQDRLIGRSPRSPRPTSSSDERAAARHSAKCCTTNSTPSTTEAGAASSCSGPGVDLPRGSRSRSAWRSMNSPPMPRNTARFGYGGKVDATAMAELPPPEDRHYGRTTRHPGYAVSQRLRKRVELIFGWMKTVGMSSSLFPGSPGARRPSPETAPADGEPGLAGVSPDFQAMYSSEGRPSIPPEKQPDGVGGKIQTRRGALSPDFLDP